MYRTLKILTIAQAFAQTSAPIVVLLGGIVGARLAPTPGLATLPVALMIVGAASTTIPAALFMGKFGRRVGFLLASSYACLAGLLAAYAISRASFLLFCLATFMVGSQNAFVLQYRFAVAESVPPEKVGQSLSILMLAGVVAAFVGPEVAQRFQTASSLGEFAGSFLGLSVFMLGNIIILCFYREAEVNEEVDNLEQRSL